MFARCLLAGLIASTALPAVETAAATMPEPYVPPADNQLMNLFGVKLPKHPVPDITWPAQAGEADICLWNDDKFAACSITVDDNCKPDHDWWIKLGEETGIKVTWFVITGGVGKSNPSFNGEWSDYQKLLDAGHDVQSHSITHSKHGDTDPDEKTIKEYALSRQTIEDQLPGHKCVALAFPWGKGRTEFAKDYFIANRGVSGTPQPANNINYMNVCKGGADQNQINAILGLPFEKKTWLNNPRYKRGWISPLWHYVPNGHTTEEKAASREKARKTVENLASYSDRIWFDTFANVATYGQERDSATMTTATNDKTITIELTDLMRDDLFALPLCIKVRLPDGSTTVSATQGDSQITSTFLAHEGAPYALVYGVPDRGTISVTAQ